MKVGDLVMLSSYGKKIKRTGWIKNGDVGIIKKVGPWDTYRILWSVSTYHHGQKRDYPTRGNCYYWQFALNRSDLKFAK